MLSATATGAFSAPSSWEAGAADYTYGAGSGAGAGAEEYYGGFFSQTLAIPAPVVLHILSFLPGSSLRNLAISCSSLFALAYEQMHSMVLRVPKTKRVTPLFRGSFMKYAALRYLRVAHRGAPPMDNLSSLLICCESLTTIHLSGNGIGSTGVGHIAKALAICAPTLSTLDLGENVIGDNGAQSLATLVGRCESLTTLSLASNLLGRRGAKAVLEVAAAKCPRLQRLLLSTNRPGIMDEGATAVAKGMRAWKDLRELHLADNDITSSGVAEVARALAEGSCRKLWLLHLQDNGLGVGPAGGTALAKALPTPGALPRLADLRLGGNSLGPRGAAVVTACAGALPRLRVLDLSRDALADAGTQGAPRLLSMTRTLQLLDVSHSGIRDIGIGRLAAALQTCPTLRVLIISGNRFGHVGAKQLAAGLPLSALSVLRMEDCGIGAYGMMHLAEALSTSPVQVLNLGCNNLKNEGVAYLLAGLREARNFCLTSLDLSANGLILGAGSVTTAASVVVPPLASEFGLTALNLSGNRLEDDGVAAVCTALLDNETLRCLNINGTGMSPRGVIRIAELLPALSHLRTISIRANDLSGTAAAIRRLDEVPDLAPWLQVL